MSFKFEILLVLAIFSVQANGMNKIKGLLTSSNKQNLPRTSTSTSCYNDSHRHVGLIHMKVEKFSEFLKGPSKLLSEPVFIQGIPWRLLVMHRNDSGHLGCYIRCNGEDTDDEWSCVLAEGTIRLLGSKFDYNIEKSLSKGRIFKANDNNWGFVMVEIKELMKPENGLYDKEHDILITEAEIKAESPQGLKHPPTVRERDDSLINRMRNLWQKREDADVQFLVGNYEDNKEIITAHRTVLSAASTVFRAMFRFDKQQNKMLKAIGKHTETAKKTPIVVDDIEPEVFRVMLNYIYTDELDGLNNDNLFDVMKAADKYDIPGLIQDCVDQPTLEANNVLDLLSKAYLSGIAEVSNSVKCLIMRCWAFVDQNIYAVLESAQLPHIDRNLMAELFGRNELMMSRRRGQTDYGEIALWPKSSESGLAETQSYSKRETRNSKQKNS